MPRNKKGIQEKTSSKMSRRMVTTLVFSFGIAFLMFYMGLSVTKVLFGEENDLLSNAQGKVEYLFDNRHKYTPQYLPADGDKLRFVTYNILNNGFVTTEIAQKMYSYCPKYALSKEYRRPLILNELLGYHGDFLNLQECDEDMFNDFLSVKLQKEGYNGVFMKKHKGRPEGEAIFYRTERYEHVKDLSIAVKDAINHLSNKQLRSKLPKDVLAILLNRKALGLIHIFHNTVADKRKDICILNTHLYYLPNVAHIRLVQMAILLNYLNANIADISKIDVIVAGDLNSPVDEPLIKYLSGTTIDKKDPVWAKTGEIDYISPFALHTLSGAPDYTCYSPPEIKTYDHVFGSSGLLVLTFVPIPSVDEIRPYTGVPSVAYPSDHFALVLDILQR